MCLNVFSMMGICSGITGWAPTTHQDSVISDEFCYFMISTFARWMLKSDSHSSNMATLSLCCIRFVSWNSKQKSLTSSMSSLKCFLRYWMHLTLFNLSSILIFLNHYIFVFLMYHTHSNFPNQLMKCSKNFLRYFYEYNRYI